MRKGEWGFTLVEIAMVLIVIALIIGAVLKGQDLIKNANAKRFASFIRNAEIAQWTFFERFGRFAGDGDNDGQIEYRTRANGRDLEEPSTALQAELRDFDESITIGGSTFWIRFGYYRDTSEPILCIFRTPGTVDRNNPDHAFTADDITLARNFDVIEDGEAQARQGRVVGLRRTIQVAGTAISFNGNRGLGLPNGKIPTRDDWVFGEASGRDTRGLLYFFDRGGL